MHTLSTLTLYYGWSPTPHPKTQQGPHMRPGVLLQQGSATAASIVFFRSSTILPWGLPPIQIKPTLGQLGGTARLSGVPLAYHLAAVASPTSLPARLPLS